jgi:hypothetical protein
MNPVVRAFRLVTAMGMATLLGFCVLVALSLDTPMPVPSAPQVPKPEENDPDDNSK